MTKKKQIRLSADIIKMKLELEDHLRLIENSKTSDEAETHRRNYDALISRIEAETNIYNNKWRSKPKTFEISKFDSKKQRMRQ